MKIPSHAYAYQVLWLQLVADGRQEALFGSNAIHAREALAPFMLGEKFPGVYLEFPLIGEPFLDVTVLYSKLARGTRIESDAAADTGSIIDWFAESCSEMEHVCFGFELDAHKEVLPRAAVHFQPRGHTELVEPFFAAAGEPEKARLYLDLAKRMPAGWSLSFFGMFRGREGSPLRVCGYFDQHEIESCAADSAYIASFFDEIGFSAYNPTMLEQISSLLSVAPGSCDFQFDVFPDGSLGDIFAIDVQFHIERPERVVESFAHGPIADVFGLFEKWGTADERWKLAADAALARALPMEKENGDSCRYSFTLLPQWAKARWRNGELQPSKLYYLASAGLLD